METLLDLQAEYHAWLDDMPEALQESTTGKRLAAVCELDLDEITSIDLPSGYGRD